MRYSKLFILLLIICLSVECGFSQSRFEIGFKTGINFSSLSRYEPVLGKSYLFMSSNPIQKEFFSFQYDQVFFKRTRLGKSVAFFGTYRLMKKLSVQFGVEFNERGMDLHVAETLTENKDIGIGHEEWTNSFSISEEVKNDYVTVPLQLKYGFGNKVLVYITSGVYFDFLVRSKIMTQKNYIGTIWLKVDNEVPQNTMGTSGQSNKSVIGDQTSDLDIGFIVGGGVEAPLSQKLSFIFNISFSQGLRQLDGKNNNNTRSLPISNGSVIVEHKNYYGLNSHAQNISLNNSIGLTYKL